ncbi:MAG: M48 family metalloprotease [Pseudomonadota bacterium]
MLRQSSRWAQRTAPRRAFGAVALAAVCTAILFAAPARAQGLIRDSEIEQTLRLLSRPVFDAANIDPSSVRIFIINDQRLNAFVNGGRNMFFYAGILQELETPEQLIGVMAHETGHITGGHVVRRLAALRQARAQSILATLLGVAAGVAGGGDAAAGVSLGGQSLATRSLLSFTRGQESSADQAALTFMNRAGVDPIGMLQVLQKLGEAQAFLSNVDPYLLTHPLSGARIDALRQGVASSPARGQRVSRELRYWHGRMRAKLDGFLGRPGLSSGADSYGSPELDLYRRTINLHRLPDPDSAVASADQLIAMRPEDPFYWELKGQILLESGRGRQAVKPYRQAVSLRPGDALIQAGLGAALLTIETPETDKEALSVLERAALEDPLDAKLRRSLAIAYARDGQEGMAAVATAERLALTGQRKDARRQAKRAKDLLPVGSSGWLRAEDVLVAVGDSDD